MIEIRYLAGFLWHPRHDGPRMATLRLGIVQAAEAVGIEVLVWTSGFRPGDPRKHGDGDAIDAQGFNRAGGLIGEETGQEWAAVAQGLVGVSYDVFYHRGSAWHLHAEDESGRVRATPPVRDRIVRTVAT